MFQFGDPRAKRATCVRVEDTIDPQTREAAGDPGCIYPFRVATISTLNYHAVLRKSEQIEPFARDTEIRIWCVCFPRRMTFFYRSSIHLLDTFPLP